MNLGMPEMIFILLLALVVVGPKRLPGLARQLGKFMAEFKRASNEFKNQLETEMMNIELEERAKKQEAPPQILPPESSWQPPIRPAPEIVGRGSSDQISETETGRAASADPPEPHAAIPAVKPASPDA